MGEMGSKWRRARDALGLHLCILSPGDRNESPTPNETVSRRSCSSDVALLVGARESTVGPVQSSQVSLGSLHLIKPSVRLSPIRLPDLCEYLQRRIGAELQFKMVWEGQGREGSVEYEFYSFLPRTKDYYKILEVDFDATLDAIRSNYLRLALKWHPDKQRGQTGATLKFQEINEAYKVLRDPVKRREYDVNGVCDVEDYNLIEYLHRFKGLILTCNGLGMGNAPRWY